MFNKLFVLFLFIILNKISFSQQSEKSIYALYGHHLPTKYKVVRGKNNLIGRKNVFSSELGLNLDYTIIDHWKLRTGISGHLLFLDEVSYGVSGPVPPGIPDQSISKYSRGLEYIESVSVSIPVKALYQFQFLSGNSVSVSGGPFIAIYFPASDEMAGMQSTQNGNLIRKYWVTRHFKNYNQIKVLVYHIHNLNGILIFSLQKNLNIMAHLTSASKLILVPIDWRVQLL